MKNFYDLKYERCDYEKIKLDIDSLVSELKVSKNVSDYITIVKKINRIHNHVEEM